MTRVFRNFLRLFLALQLAVAGGPLAANGLADSHIGAVAGHRTIVTESWIEEWDPVSGQWVRVAEDAGEQELAADSYPTLTTTYVNGVEIGQTREAARFARPVLPQQIETALAHYGPFVVTSEEKAVIVGATDSSSPVFFDAMLRDYPQIAMLEMIEAPGTSNDIANLAVGRRIREAGISTHVPAGGSVRSGAVELFLAGVHRSIDDGAQFAVHSWLDNYGREADDFAANHPAHRLYLDYYVEMGMSETLAGDFYAMTNSVPHHSARWLDADEMRQWLPASAPKMDGAPLLAYTDISGVSLALLDY